MYANYFILVRFLSEPSGGDRGLAVAAALFETFGKYFGIFGEVNRKTINTSDKSSGSVGDIECLDKDGSIRLAVEVKERDITLTDVRSSIRKARKVSLKELFLNAPGEKRSDENEINGLISNAWASGTNIYRLSINELIRVGLALTGEKGRKDFLVNIGNQLDRFNTQPVNRIRWKDLLEDI